MNPAAIKVFSDSEAVATAFAEDFLRWSEAVLQRQAYATVALSGGSTPQRLFEIWGQGTDGKTQPVDPQPDWNRIHFFWGDERCVPPTDPDSNYGVAHQLWLSKVNIEANNIHRVLGEADPNQALQHYIEEITQYTRARESGPSVNVLDLVILGMGSDGHVASIFPDRLELFQSPEICAVAKHPVSGQVRITFSGQLILQAARVVFLITGADKAKVLQQVLDREGDYLQYPFAHVKGEQVEYFLDAAAASKLTIE